MKTKSSLATDISFLTLPPLSFRQGALSWNVGANWPPNGVPTTNFLQWTSIGTATGDLGGAFNFADTNARKFRYRFYRTTN